MFAIHFDSVLVDREILVTRSSVFNPWK